jgi:hypothetical protein
MFLNGWSTTKRSCASQPIKDISAFPRNMSQAEQEIDRKYSVVLVTKLDHERFSYLNTVRTEKKNKYDYKILLCNDKRLNGKTISINKKHIHEDINGNDTYVGKHRISPDGIEAFLKSKNADEKVIYYAKQNAIKTLWAFKKSKEVEHEGFVLRDRIEMCNTKEVYLKNLSENAKDNVYRKLNPIKIEDTGKKVVSVIPKKELKPAKAVEWVIDECDICRKDARVTADPYTRQYICKDCNECLLEQCKECNMMDKVENYDSIFMANEEQHKRMCLDCQCKYE